MPEVTSNTNVFTNLLKAAEKECSEMILAKPDTQHYIGDCTITVYGPLDTDQQDLNNSSIVCKIAYNQTSILFTGDAEEQTEKKLVKEYGNELNCTMLKVAHHGSSSSSSPRFLDTCNPQIAVISCAEDNEYGHPHTEVLERLNQRNIEYYRTDIDHTVSFICDGNTVTKQ